MATKRSSSDAPVFSIQEENLPSSSINFRYLLLGNSCVTISVAFWPNNGLCLDSFG